MKKGFTLMELLAIIVVLVGVFAVVVPQINNSINTKKIEDFDKLATSIENAAKNYVSSNYDIGNDPIPYFVTLKTLIDQKLVIAPIVDPRTGSDFNEMALVTIYQDEEDVYIYEFDNDNLMPAVTRTSIVSNNSLNNKYARNGHTITLSIRFNKPIVDQPTVTIGGRTATVTGSGTLRSATYLIPAGESTMTEGTLPISITGHKDNNDVIGDPHTTITTGGNVIYDRTPPAFTYFYIGGISNPDYVISRNTILHVSATGASQMCISENTTCNNWEPYSTTKAYTLSTGDGVKTLNIWFRDNAGNISGYYSDDVMLSTTPPAITYFYIGGVDNPTYINNRNTSINILVPNATQMCISTTLSCSTWEPYVTTKAHTLSTGDGTKTLNAWFRNIAGNTTAMTSDGIILDTVPPTCTNSGGSTAWTTGSRTITGACSDSGSGCVENAIKTYTTNINSTTESPGQVCDNADNCTNCLGNRTVRIDTGTPSAPSISGGSTTWTSGSRTITTSGGNAGLSGLLRREYRTRTYSSGVWSSWSSWTTYTSGITYSTSTHREVQARIVNNAGTPSAASTTAYVRIDTSTPTAPTISGGSTAWTTGSRTITISGGNAGISGLLRREYRTRTAGGTWGSWTTYSSSLTYSTTRNWEIQARVINNVGTAGATSLSYIRIDTGTPTAPSISGGSTAWTTVSRTITTSGGNAGTSGLLRREYRTRTSTNLGSTYGSWSSWTTYSSSLTYSSSTYREVQARIVNNAGRASAASATAYVRVDRSTLSSPSISGGSTAWTNGNRTITTSGGNAGFSGLSSRQYRTRTSLNNGLTYGSWSSWTTYSSGITYSSNTYRQVEARIVSNSGKTATSSTAFVKIDKTNPVITRNTTGINIQQWNGSTYYSPTLTTPSCTSAACSATGIVCRQPGSFMIYNATATASSFSGISSFTVDRVFYRHDGAQTATYGCLSSRGDNPCLWQITYRAQDNAGNVSTFRYNWTIDYTSTGSSLPQCRIQ